MTTTPLFDAKLLRRYAGAGPRYTSYPTAADFVSDFGADDYEFQVEQSNGDPVPRALSLYVHIPFCQSLCYYCGCNKVITRNEEKVGRYLSGLFRETEMQGALFDKDREVRQLHWGGGTPTYLNKAQISQLMNTLRENFNLLESDEREFSIEVDPRGVDADMIAHLAKEGFNRLSLGVQDFNHDVQEAVNRVQSTEAVLELIRGSRHSGFKSVSVDLIYGLPKQSRITFAETLDTLLLVRPNRISVYSYAHLPKMFRAQRLIANQDLPSAEEKLGMLSLTIEKLTQAGYLYIGMDHFALPEDDLAVALNSGTLQRNFQGYSTHGNTDLVALGVSAIGNVADCYAQNAKTVREYLDHINNGELAIERGCELNRDDHLRAEIIQNLMCDGHVDFRELEHRFNFVFPHYFRDELNALAPLSDDGLVVVSGKSIDITPRGRLLMRPVAQVFDAYRTHTASGQFSKVV